MKNLLAYLLCVPLCSNVLIAQTLPPYIISQITTPGTSFTQMRDITKSYYDSVSVASGGADSLDDGDAQEFKRWDEFWNKRVGYPSASAGGDFSMAYKYFTPVSGGVCNTSVGGSSWYPLGPNQMSTQNLGRLNTVAMDPTNSNIIYAGSYASGLFKTTDGGAHWVNVTDVLRISILGINAIAIDPNNTNTIYIGTGYLNWINHVTYGVGVYKSTDGGITWNTTGLAFSVASPIEINDIKVHPINSNIVFALGDKNIYKSIDGGATWPVVYSTLNPEDVNFKEIDFNIANPNIMYASTTWYGGYPQVLTPTSGAQFFSSTDGGNTWVEKAIPNANYITYSSPGVIFDSLSSASQIIAIDETPADPTAVYIAYNSGGAPGTFQYIQKSLDNGNTWTLIDATTAIVNVSASKCAFEVSNSNPTTFYVGSLYMYRKTATGSWIVFYGGMHDDVRGLAQNISSTMNDLLIVATDGGIGLNNSGTLSWNNINGAGLSLTTFYGFDDFHANQRLIGGALDNSNLKKDALGVWTKDPTIGGDGGKIYVDDLSAIDNTPLTINVFGSGNHNMYKSSNGGASFFNISNPESGGGLNLDYNFNPNESNKLWLGQNNLWYKDGTAPWQLKWDNLDPLADDANISAFEIAPSNSQIIYIAYGQPTWNLTLVPQVKFYKSINGGTSFLDLSANMYNSGVDAQRWSSATDIVIDPKNSDHLFVSFDAFWEGSPGQGYNRVVESNDGGITWVDKSNGLQGFPVLCLEYQNGTDDVIYAGTDIGVFRWNKAANIWECFNANLPVVSVTNIEINYCTNTIKISTYGRGIWEAYLPTVVDYHITSSQTWQANTFQSFNNTVIIDAGKTLTVKGTVSFSPTAKLIVRPGAKLIIDGGRLTNSCGTLWPGVEVGGTSSQPQTIVAGGLSPYQGIVEMKNSAIIENAKNGIHTGTYTPAGSIDFGSFGGIIFASNSSFLNNNRDVVFLLYPSYNNKSYFNNCKFDINSKHPITIVPNAHITMWGVKNVNIRGCDFSNSAYVDFPTGAAGNGIFSIDAKYNVIDYCSSIFYPCPAASIKQSTFDHLDYGVNASNSDPLVNLNINHAKFTNFTYDGIHLAGVNYASILNCSFNIGTYSYLNSGLYLDFCKYYQVQNNQFFTTSGGYIGIYVKDSKTGAHEIYRNTFTGLLAGIIALSDNSGATNIVDGLTSHCNIFSGNQYDQGITGVSPTSIAFVQGVNSGASNPTTLVRNQYSAICGSRNKFPIDFSTKAVIHACNIDASTQPLPQPSCSDLLVNVITTTIPLNYAIDCADKTGLSKAILSAKIVELGNSAIALKQAYNNLIDGGNTTSLLASVNSNMSSGTLKNLLISKSPYLSDQVLIAYLTKLPAPPNGHIKDIIIANSPVTANVKAAVDALSLPNGIQNQINNAQHGISARLTKEAIIIQTNYDQKLYINDKIRYFLNDTIEPNPMDSVLYMLKAYPREDLTCDLIQAYSNKEDYTKANALIDSLEAINELDDYCRFQKLLIELKQAPEKCYKMQTDAATKAQVEDYANDCNKQSCPNAQALLKQVFDYQYPILRMVPLTYHSMTPQLLADPIKEDDNSLLSLYPNPANDYLNIMFHNAESDIGVIEIRNVLGELVDKIQIKNSEPYLYNTEALDKSIYFVSLYVDGKLIDNKKLILVK